MKAATRILTLVGLGLMTGATLGAGPAMASTSAPDTAVRAATTTAAQPHRDRDRDWVEGHYDTRRECEWAGRRGEWRDRWDDYDCERVRFGPYRGEWRLSVEKSWDWRDRDHDRGRDHHDRHGDDD